LPNDYDIALEMLKAKVTYWEHYGWARACDDALELLVLDSQYDLAKDLANWLISDAPKGVNELFPAIAKYARGDFPVQDIQEFNDRLQQWGARKHQTLMSSLPKTSSGQGVTFQEFLDQQIESVSA
jgi:hypothetical protein